MRYNHILSVILATAIWGLNISLSKIGMQDIPPLFYTALRFVVLVPALCFVPKPNVQWKYILMLAFFWGVIQFSCLNFALVLGISAGLSSLLFQSSTFFAMLFSCLLLKEKPTVFQMLGLGLGFVGLALIGWDIDKNASFTGFFLALVAAASWGFGNVIIKKATTKQSFEFLIWTSALPAFPLLLLAFIVEGQDIKQLLTHALPLRGTGCVLYSSFVAVLIGGSLWMRLFRNYSVNQITGFGLLVPLFAIFFSAILLGESFTFYNLLASAFIVAGLLISQIAPKVQLRIRLEALVNKQGALEIKLCRFQRLPVKME